MTPKQHSFIHSPCSHSWSIRLKNRWPLPCKQDSNEKLLTSLPTALLIPRTTLEFEINTALIETVQCLKIGSHSVYYVTQYIRKIALIPGGRGGGLTLLSGAYAWNASEKWTQPEPCSTELEMESVRAGRLLTAQTRWSQRALGHAKIGSTGVGKCGNGVNGSWAKQKCGQWEPARVKNPPKTAGHRYYGGYRECSLVGLSSSQLKMIWVLVLECWLTSFMDYNNNVIIFFFISKMRQFQSMLRSQAPKVKQCWNWSTRIKTSLIETEVKKMSL